MSSSAGRRSAAYVTARRLFQWGAHPCWLQYPGCEVIGRTVDHDPPLSSAARPELWRGTYRPACKSCQDRQGAHIRNGTSSSAWQW